VIYQQTIDKNLMFFKGKRRNFSLLAPLAHNHLYIISSFLSHDQGHNY